MAYTRDWDETQPTDDQYGYTTGEWFRKTKIDIAERLKSWIYGFISGESKVGLKKAPLVSQSSDPDYESDKGVLYVKEINGIKELFYRDSSGNVKQLTVEGKLNIETDEASVLNVDKVDGYDASNFSFVVSLPDNGDSVVWEKIGELRGIASWVGAELSFIIYGSGDVGCKGRQTLFVNAQQRGENGIKVDVYSLENGGVCSRRITVGYVQVGTFDFDIYIKRENFNPCIVVGHDSSFHGSFITNPETLTSEPSGIVYVNANKIWHSGNDGSGSGLDADLLRGLPADFTCSKSTNGYTKLPNGLILQWGHYEKSSPFAHEEEITITFPISFPNALLSFSAIVSPGINGSGDTYAFFSGIKQNSDGNLYNFSQSSITVEVWDVAGNSPPNGKGHLFWIAIGY